MKAARPGPILLVLVFVGSSVAAGAQVEKAPVDGDSLYGQGKYVEALEAYRVRIQAGPEDVGAHCGAGRCLIALGRLQEATDLMQRAARLPGADAETWSVLGQAWYWDACSILGNPDDPRAEYTGVILSDAESHLERAVAGDPQAHLALYFLGKVRAALDRAEEACVSLRRAVELRPDETSYHFALAEALEKSGNHRAAADAYMAAAAHSPERFHSYIRGARLDAACCLARAGEFERAVDAFKKSYLEDPRDVTLFRKAWEVFATDPERHEGGVRLFDELDRALPDAMLPAYYLGYLQLVRDRRAEARKAFEKVITTEQGRALAGVWAMLGTMYYVDDKDVETAERHLLKALELEPRNRMAYLTLTHMVTYWIRDQRATDRAIDLTRKILEYQPDNGHQWGILAAFSYNRSLRQQETEPSPEALEYYARAEKYAPDDPDIKCGLGKLYNAAKQYEKSERYFLEALELDPFHLETLMDYGYMCKDTGQFAKAKALWERFLAVSPGMHRLHARVLIDLETVTRALEPK